MTRIDIVFTTPLTSEQEQILVDDTYKIYWELKSTCFKLSNLKNSWDFKLAMKVGGKSTKNFKRVVEIANTMHDNLVRCKEGTITSDEALFRFERISDIKDKYFIEVNEKPFADIKLNVIKKDNFAVRLLYEYEKKFGNTIKKMKYADNYCVEVL
jgi:hypothetical protein